MWTRACSWSVLLLLLVGLRPSAEPASLNAIERRFYALLSEYGIAWHLSDNLSFLRPEIEYREGALLFRELARDVEALPLKKPSPAELILQAQLVYEATLQSQRLGLAADWVVLGFIPQEGQLAHTPLGRRWYAHAVASWTGTWEKAEHINQAARSSLDSLEYQLRRLETEHALDSLLRRALLAEEAFRALILIEEHLQAKFEGLFPALREEAPLAFAPITDPTWVGTSGYYSAGVLYYPVGTTAGDLVNLYLHEGYPGHHYQQQWPVSQQEITEYLSHHGFVEGWATYAETLEVGAIPKVCSAVEIQYARLQYQKQVAARMVLDVGVHAEGWADEAALAFMAKYFPGNESLCRRELNRVKKWPGQAAAYFVGARSLEKLRFQQAQSPTFDLWEFHAQLLGHGQLPLSILPLIFEE